MDKQKITFEPLEEGVNAGRVTETITSYEDLENILVTVLPDDLGWTSFAMYRSMSTIETRAKQGYSLLSKDDDETKTEPETETETEPERKFAWLQGKAKCRVTCEWAVPTGKYYSRMAIYIPVPDLIGFVTSVEFTHLGESTTPYTFFVELLDGKHKSQFNQMEPRRTNVQHSNQSENIVRFDKMIEMMNDEKYYLRIIVEKEHFLDWIHFDASFGFIATNNNFWLAIREKRHPIHERVFTAVSAVAAKIPGWNVPRGLLQGLYGGVNPTGDFKAQVNELGDKLRHKFHARLSEYYEFKRMDQEVFQANAADRFIRRLDWYNSFIKGRLVY